MKEKKKEESSSYEKMCAIQLLQITVVQIHLKIILKKTSTPLFIIASLSPLKFHHSTINTAS